MIKEMVYSDYHEVIGWELRDAIKRYFTTWERVLESEEPGRDLWTKAIEQRRLTVVILSAVLLEATINFYLCTKCSAKRFKQISKDKNLGTLYAKCTQVPKQFHKSYSVPESCDLAKDLRALIARRNAVVHSKPMMSIDGDNRHKGNEPDAAWNEHEFIGRCATAPFRLVDCLMAAGPDGISELMTLRHCTAGPAHQFESGQQRLELRLKVPKALLAEVMEQVHDREIAFSCIFRMGSNPKLDETGHISIWAGGEKFIRLKPLKYFTKTK